MLALMRIVHCLYAVSCYDTNEYGFCCDQCNYKTRKPLAANGIIHGRQGCISCGILVSGIRARGVSSEHMENMEMFSCSPT